MKIIKTYIILMYIFLLMCVSVPFAVNYFVSNYGLNTFGQVIFTVSGMIYALILSLVASVTVVFRWVCIAKGIRTARNLQFDQLLKSYKMLKFGLVPFHLVLFLVVVIFSPILYPMSLVLIPLSSMFGYMTIVQSGIFGIIYVSKSELKVSKIHYLLQFIPIADIISAIFVSKKQK